MQGIVFDIKRFAIHDGPGLRTTIFFKGCPLNCWWCHNPEGISPDIQSCFRTLRLGDRQFQEPQIIGKPYTLIQLIGEIEKETLFYEESQGGVTLSGGEPLAQYDFVSELLRECRNREINTCLDTTGFIQGEKLKAVLPLVDLFLFDIKLLDDTLHTRYTGVSNRIILENFELLVREKKPVIVRYPLIPGVNSTPMHLEALHSFVTNRIEEIHLLPYHTLSVGKLRQLGRVNRMEGTSKMPADKINSIKEMFTQLGYKVSIGG